LNAADLYHAIIEGAVERGAAPDDDVCAIMGDVRSYGAAGTGSEVMQRIAVPLVGG